MVSNATEAHEKLKLQKGNFARDFDESLLEVNHKEFGSFITLKSFLDSGSRDSIDGETKFVSILAEHKLSDDAPQ